MKTQGRITNVYYDRSGAGVTEEYSIGDATIWVDTNADFNEDGGQCVIDGVVYGYTLGEEEEERDQILLDSSLTTDILEGTFVATYPITDVKMAMVAVSDEEGLDGGDMTCTIDHKLTSMIPDGPREIGQGEFVEVDDEEGDLVVRNIRGEEGKTLSESLTGPIPPSAMTDGLPPTEAPVIAVAPLGIGVLRVSWPRIANPDPVTYRVYASSATPVALIPDNYVGFTTGDSYTLSRLADDTAISYDADTYFVVVATDADSPEGATTPASNEASSRPRKADNESISAEYAYVGFLEAYQINAGQMFADFAELDRIVTSGGDPRVVIDNAGIIGTMADGAPRFSLPTDPELPAEFQGILTAESATIKDRLSIRGRNNEYARGSRVVLADAVSAPASKPSMSVEWPENSVDPFPYEWIGLGVKKFSDGYWYGGLGIWGGAWNVYRWSEDGSGNLVGREDVVSYSPGTNGFQEGIQDVLEHQGRLHVLVTDHGVDNSWTPTQVKIRTYTMGTFAEGHFHVVPVPRGGRKMALSETSQSDVVAVVRPDMDQGHRWRVMGFRLNHATGVPDYGAPTMTYSTWFDHTLNAGRDEDVDTAQYAPTSSITPGGSGQRWFIKSRGSACLFAFDPGTRNRTLNDEANMTPLPSGIQGSVWFDGARWHAWQQKKIFHLSTFRWSGTYTSTKKVWARYSWFDSNPTGGQHESPVSEAQPLNLPKLAHFRVSTAEVPPPDAEDPTNSITGVRIWLKYDSNTEPAITAYGRASADLPDGVVTKRFMDPLDVSVSPPNSGTPAPFPSSTPAEISSSKADAEGPIIRLYGSGSGRVGPYEWDEDGEFETPYARVARSASGSVNATYSEFPFVVDQGIQGGMVLAGGGVEVPIDGLYSVDAKVLLNPTTGLTQVGVAISVTNNGDLGNLTDYYYEQKSGNANLGAPGKASGKYRLRAGARVTVLVQSSVGTHTINVSNVGFNNLTVAHCGFVTS